MKGVEPPRRRRQILSLVRLPIPPHPHFTSYIVGGGWWIRTTESNANRFTVCPLWPLGKSSTLELVIGIEPTTCWLQVSCSTVEPHQHIGGNSRTWTCDPMINSHLLYQLSHIPMYWRIVDLIILLYSSFTTLLFLCLSTFLEGNELYLPFYTSGISSLTYYYSTFHIQ